MKYYLTVIFVLLSSGGVQSEEGRVQTVTMPMVINSAACGDYEKALELLASLAKSKDYDRQLIVGAETAIRLARIADVLDPWKGSDFFKATPWYKVDDFWGSDEQVKKRDLDYFDSIIAHSVSRLEGVSKIRSK